MIGHSQAHCLEHPAEAEKCRGGPCLRRSVRKPSQAAPTPPPTHPPSLNALHPQPLMRADFTLFDEYEHVHEGAPPFPFPVTAFWGSCDRRIKQHMVQVGGAGRRRARLKAGVLPRWGWPAAACGAAGMPASAHAVTL